VTTEDSGADSRSTAHIVSGPVVLVSESYELREWVLHVRTKRTYVVHAYASTRVRTRSGADQRDSSQLSAV
jgi:hypothetical protein